MECCAALRFGFRLILLVPEMQQPEKHLGLGDHAKHQKFEGGGRHRIIAIEFLGRCALSGLW